MKPPRLTIAAFDPSTGAGLTSDLLTWSELQASERKPPHRDLAVCTGQTLQNNTRFDGVIWTAHDAVFQQLELLRDETDFSFVKIGLIENWSLLWCVVKWLRAANPQTVIVWDPVLSASAGYDFQIKTPTCSRSADRVKLLRRIMRSVALTTPNRNEAAQLFGLSQIELNSIDYQMIRAAFVIKSFQVENDRIGDRLILPDQTVDLPVESGGEDLHGTGCRYSSAVLYFLSEGKDVVTSCSLAQHWVARARRQCVTC